MCRNNWFFIWGFKWDTRQIKELSIILNKNVFNKVYNLDGIGNYKGIHNFNIMRIKVYENS